MFSSYLHDTEKSSGLRPVRMYWLPSGLINTVSLTPSYRAHRPENMGVITKVTLCQLLKMFKYKARISWNFKVNHNTMITLALTITYYVSLKSSCKWKCFLFLAYVIGYSLSKLKTVLQFTVYTEGLTGLLTYLNFLHDLWFCNIIQTH